MKAKLSLLFILLITLCFINGCAYRSAMNSGKKCYEGKLYDESVTYFNVALAKKPDKADAKLWLSKSEEKAAENHYNKAMDYERRKAWADAATEYGKTMSFIPDYKDAKVKLEEMKYTDATESYQNGIECLNVRSWDEALSKFGNTLQLVPANTKLAEDAKKGIQEAKEKAAEEHYQKGLNFEKKELWQDALSEYQIIDRYKNGYKDTGEHLQVCHQALAAYFYQRAIACDEKDDFLGAFNNYQSVTSHVPNYEDTKERIIKVSKILAERYMKEGDIILAQAEEAELLKRRSLAGDALSTYETASGYDRDCPGLSSKIKQAQNLMIIRIAVLPIKGGNDKIAKEITNGLINFIVKNGGERIKAVDRTQLDTVMSEIGLSSSGLVDENTLKKVGKIKGVDILAYGEITDYSFKPDRKSQTRTETKSSSDGKSTYQSNYTYYTEERTASIKIAVKLINAATAEIEWTNIIETSASDSGSWRDSSQMPKIESEDELGSKIIDKVTSQFSSEIVRKYM
jgi:tetratricopeptide (TPR) repeat protein